MLRRAPRSLAMSVCAATLALAPAARAQADEDSPDELVRQGADLERAGEHEQAAEVLRRAVEARRTGRALAQLGYAEQSLGQMLEAEEHLAAALTFADERWVRHHRRAVENVLATVRASIGAVRVTSNIDGAEVRVRGAVVGRTPMAEALRVPVGRVRFELRAPGYASAAREVTVLSGEEAQAHVPLERDAPAARVEAPPPERCAAGLVMRDGLCFAPELPDDGSVSSFRWMAYVAGGAAVVSAGVAIGLGLDGDSLESQYLAQCGGVGVPRGCEAVQREAQATLSSQATAVNVLWALAALSAGVAVTGVGLELRESRARRFAPRAGLSLAATGVRWTW